MKDHAASVRQKLLNRARETGRPFDELLIHYAMERFLYRLSVSEHRDRFILKGALMLTVWEIEPPRTTRDIDLLGHMENSVDVIADIMREVCMQDMEQDGLRFDPATVTSEQIIEHGMYEGVRIGLRGYLKNAEVVMRLDIGFGDPVVPAPAVLDYPTILDMPKPVLRGYTRESAIAEKFQAMVKLGEINSRMKDFYDIQLLARQFDFDGDVLSEAIRRTFEQRNTPLPADTLVFQSSFAEQDARQNQWRAFIRRQRLESAPERFPDVVQTIRAFLEPVMQSLTRDEVFTGRWRAQGPWVMV